MAMLVQLHIGFILCALSSSRDFLRSQISILYGFSDLPRVPAPLCDEHGLLRLRVNMTTTTTKLVYKQLPFAIDLSILTRNSS